MFFTDLKVQVLLFSIITIVYVQNESHFWFGLGSSMVVSTVESQKGGSQFESQPLCVKFSPCLCGCFQDTSSHNPKKTRMRGFIGDSKLSVEMRKHAWLSVYGPEMDWKQIQEDLLSKDSWDRLQQIHVTLK